VLALSFGDEEMPPLESQQVEGIDQNEEGQDDDFDSGFDNQPTTPTETPESKVEDKPVIEAAVAVADAPKFVQITQKQLDDLMASAARVEEIRATSAQQIDKAFGKIGGVERLIQQLQTSTPAGQAVELSEDDFSELKAEYPELAEMQMKGLTRALSKLQLRGTGESLDPEKVSDMVSQRLDPALKGIDEKVEMLVESRLLARDFPDWREIVDAGKPDSKAPYRTWLTAQPADYQQKLNTTNDSSLIADSIRKFRETEKAKAAASKRQSRIDAAVTERGVGGYAASASDDDDDFNEGFKKG